MSDITLVVVTYNRPYSLKRLLHSLKKANYNGDRINLYISIDKGDNSKILEVANKVEWKHGRKIINYNEKNLGLKKHILQCGDLTYKFGNIILLEDDIYVSKGFYLYAKQVLDFFKDEENIAGYSLYSYRINENVNLPFLPLYEGYDVFFMKLPSSWGQIWTKKQWDYFRKWYNNNQNIDFQNQNNLPKNIIDWPDSSWKKYFALYMVKNNKYFVYPHYSLSSNFADSGTNIKSNNNKFQVPILYSTKNEYSLTDLKKTISVYNVFQENIYLYKHLGLTPDELTIDLYGIKKNYRRYLLTTKVLDFKVVKSYGLRMRPIELSVLNKIKGNNIFLYDTNYIKKNIESKFKNEFNIIKYHYSTFNRKKYINLMKYKIQMFMRKIFNKI